MAVDQPEFGQRVGASANGLVPHSCEQRDLAAAHRKFTVEHRKGHRNGAGATRDGMIDVLELVYVFDPAQLLLGEGRLVTHVHNVHGDRPWRVLLKNIAVVGVNTAGAEESEFVGGVPQRPWARSAAQKCRAVTEP